MTYKKGIDVSDWNGKIDWEKVKASGIEFAMIKGGYSGNVEKRFRYNIQECNRLGIPCGIYWFSYAMDTGWAEHEAHVCLEAIKPYQVDFPVAFDYEYDSVDYAARKGLTVTKALASKLAVAFCQTVRDAGYIAMNYTNKDYLTRYFDSSVSGAFPTWLAQWPYNPQLDKPPMTVDIWQYSEKGSVPGITGPVDLDVCYVDYLKKPKEKKEEPETMTGEQIYKALTEYTNALPLPDWAKAEYQKAIELGITDGTKPMEMIPRYQAAIMAMRAKRE